MKIEVLQKNFVSQRLELCDDKKKDKILCFQCNFYLLKKILGHILLDRNAIGCLLNILN